MSISKRVTSAAIALSKDDPEQALHDICSAVEATCIKLYGTGGRSNYKNFIAENLKLISMIALNGTWIGSVRFSLDHPDIKPGTDGLVGVEDVLYHLVRCGLYHAAGISKNIRFEKNNSFITMAEESVLVFPESLIGGLIVAVLACPVNADVTSSIGQDITLDFVHLPIDKIWGKKEQILELYAAIQNLKRICSTISRGAAKPSDNPAFSNTGDSDSIDP